MSEREASWILEEKYQGKENSLFKKDAERLRRGEPVGYIIGYISFLGCKIDLEYRTLIPRTETEFWVENAITEIKKTDIKNLKILDIFSGSGCIGLALLKNLDEAHVTFGDIEKTNILQIRKNLDLNNFTDKSKYDVIQSDVFSEVSLEYDYIFANPPYISLNNAHKVENSVLSYEPEKAIFAGDNGLEYIKTILKDAPKYLNKSGKLFIEIGSSQVNFIKNFLNTSTPFLISNAVFKNDQYGRPRLLELTY